MNLKLFKKVYLNLLKFAHFLLASVVNLLIRIEDKLINLRIKTERKHTKTKSVYKREGVDKGDEIDYTMIKG
jgi:hypothetical protein